MSGEAMARAQAWVPELPDATCMAVLMWLAWRVAPGGHAIRISSRTIAEGMALSPSTVKDAVRRLEASGALHVRATGRRTAAYLTVAEPAASGRPTGHSEAREAGPPATERPAHRPREAGPPATIQDKKKKGRARGGPSVDNPGQRSLWPVAVEQGRPPSPDAAGAAPGERLSEEERTRHLAWLAQQGFWRGSG